MTGAEIVLRALEDEGIRLAFGIPGTHNIELYDALATSDKVRPILVTDEQSASFMADAAWRASGVMACVNVVPGAGLTHALSGIAEAFMDCVPMLVLGCGIRRDSGMAYQLHDIDQRAIVAPVTKGTFCPQRGEDMYATIRHACALARDGRPGPVFVEIPANHYLATHRFLGSSGSSGSSARFDVTAAAQRINSAKRVLLYVGLGAAKAKLVELAEKIDAPVATTFQGKGVFPESHPLSLWPGYGASAPAFAREIAATCDVTLAIGCRFGEVATGSYGAPPPGTLIHVDIDREALGRNYPAAIAIEADAAEFVDAILPLLRRREPRGDVFRKPNDDAAGGTNGVSPARLLRALQQRFGPETIFTTDSGNGTFLAVESLVLDKPGKLLAPVDYSCMGYAVPAAIGAKLAVPDAPVVALAGDGAFLMTGLELLTAASLQVPVAIFVLRDRELAQIAQFQSVALGRKSCSVLPDYDLASIAKGAGVDCVALGTDADIPRALHEVAGKLAQRVPVVVDVAIDYSQKTHFTRGVVKTNLIRLPWKDRLRFVLRALVRRMQ